MREEDDTMAGPGSGRAFTSPDEIRERVRSLLGEEALGGNASHTEVAGPPLVSPASPQAAAALLRLASREGWRVLPQGAGVAPAFDRTSPADASSAEASPPDSHPSVPRSHAGGSAGAPGASPDLLVSARRMVGVLQYEPADLTLEVGAGTVLADLDQELATHGQWLPLLPPGGVGVTLGGLVSVGLPGALAVAYGAPRDQILGLTLADARGRVLPLGGRVVKNVAGFDLVRLVCGSRGALGLVCSVSFRLHPRPAADRTLIWSDDEAGSVYMLGRVLAGLPLPLAALEIHGHRGGELPELGPGGWGVALRAVGSEPAVTRMVDMAVDAVGSPTQTLEADASVRFALAAAADEGRARPQHRRRLPPSDLGALFHRLRLDGPGAGGEGRGGVVADLRSGMVRRLRADATGLPPLTPVAPALRRLHAGLRGVFDPMGILPGQWRYGWR